MQTNISDDLIPPTELVEAQNIGAGDFEQVGDGMIGGLISRGYFNSNSRILDVGCGLGRLARPLTKYLEGPGEYYGLDIAKDSIEWCASKYAKLDRFHFALANVYSKFYNPEGTTNGAEYKFPYEDGFFDFVMLTSVFTHLVLPDVDNYLAEISRVLKPNGWCYSTWFLITEELDAEYNRRLRTNAPDALAPIAGGFVMDEGTPEKVIFLNENTIRQLYQKHGLTIDAINYGTWCGRDVVGGYQDEIIGIKR